MAEQETPQIRRCPICDNGLLYFYRCENCQTASVICDECELIWSEIESICSSEQSASSSAFPVCPECHAENGDWSKLTLDELKELQLDRYIAGDS